ncbi:MAG: M23 family metallopeptidase [Ilumatobacteraceae bacterium]|nr:M23 family metallopeptidase [Ilumatobacteraceae bacterium]
MIGVVATLVLLSSTCYQQPVRAPVVDPFRAPACAFCWGNRGLEYQPHVGAPVVAAAPGIVTFNGVVAGVRYLVIAQPDGRTATYGRLSVVRVAVGQTVRAGETVAATTERFYFGLRQGDRYIDPAPFLGVARYRPRLVPADGSAPRLPPPPTMTCAASP